jgi:hypothetical protein
MPKTPLDFETQRTEALRLLVELAGLATEDVLTDYLMLLLPEDEAAGVLAKFHVSVLQQVDGEYVMPEAGKAMARLSKLGGSNHFNLARWSLHLAVDGNEMVADRIWAARVRGDKLLNEVSHYAYHVAQDNVVSTLVAIYNPRFFYELREVTKGRPAGSYNDKKLNLALKWLIVLLQQMLELRDSELVAVS